MRIASIYIDAFGIFHDELLSGIDSEIVLFQGNNEAGKSTLLGFVRSVLFGFPRANSRDPKYPPLSGGTHGGRIVLVSTSANEEFVVERKPGKGGGLVTVSGRDGVSGSDELLRQLLGGATYDLFKNIYAFGLSELHTMDALKAENVKSVIYGATAGTAMLALPRADKRIKEQLERLFKPGGSKPAINKHIVELQRIQSELREASKGIVKYEQACSELKHVEHEVRVRRHDLAQNSRNEKAFSSYGRLWNEWLTVQEHERALQELREVVESFPEEGVARLEKEVDSRERYQKDLAEIQRRLQNVRREAEALTVSEALLGEAKTIRFLFEKKNEYVEKRKVLPLKEQERKSLETEIGNLIDTLGKDWSEQAVLEIDRSLFVRESIRSHEEKISKRDRELARADEILTDKKDQYRNSAQEALLAKEAIDRLGEPEPELEEQVILKLQHGRDEFAGAIRDIPKRQSELRQEQQQLERLIREIDPGWTAADIACFDNSVAARKQVEHFALRLKEGEDGLRDADTLCRTTENNWRKSFQRIEAAVSKLAGVPQPSASTREELDRRRSTVRALRRVLLKGDEIARTMGYEEERLSDKRRELSRLHEVPAGGIPVGVLKWAAAACEIIGTGVLVAGPLLFFDRLAEASVLGGLFFVAALGLTVLCRTFVRKNQRDLAARQAMADGIHEEIDRIEKALGACRAAAGELDVAIAQHARDINLSEDVTVDHLDALENQIEMDIRLFEERSRLAEEVQGLEADGKELEKDRQDAREKRDLCRRSLQATAREWKEHLTKIKLSAELTPGVATVVFGRVEVARQHVDGIDALRRRIRAMQDTRDAYFTLASKIGSLAEFCSGSGTDLLSEVDRFFSRLREHRKRREERRLAQQTLEEKHKVKVNTQRTLQEAQETRDEVIKARSLTLDDWRTWLVEHDLPGDLSPETAIEALDTISACVDKISKRNQLETLIDGLETAIGIYQGSVDETLSKLGRAKTDAERIAFLVDELVSDLDENKGNLRERDRIRQQIEMDEGKLESTQEEVERCREQIACLLEEGGTSNEDEFRQRGQLFSERMRLLGGIAQAEKNMRRISGESDIGTLRKILESLALEEIQTREKELALEVEDIELELEDLRSQRAELKQSIETMKSADDIARLRADEERVLEEFQQDAFDWARYAMAKYLIDRAKKKFEKEQQPKVIRDAGVFFQKITDSRYTELLAPIGEDTIQVITSKKERKKPEELSRATAEQLYLAIRFGYIRNRAECGEPLPVIMDDILVNFDPIRARYTAEAILELSREQQVLFFTCHPQTIDIFKKIDDQIPLYVLGDGHIVAQSHDHQ